MLRSLRVERVGALGVGDRRVELAGAGGELRHLAQQLRRVRVLRERALVDAQRLLELAGELEVAGDQEVELRRRVGGQAVGPERRAGVRAGDAREERGAARDRQGRHQRERQPASPSAAHRPSPSTRGCARRRRAQRFRYPCASRWRNQRRHARLDGERGRVEHQLGSLRGLVGRRDAGELRDLAGAGLLVEALRVAPLAGLERRVDVHLDEVARREERPGRVAVRAVGRDERGQHEHAAVGEELRDLADAADVLGAVGGREAEVLVQPVAHVVAVEHVGEVAALDQRVLGGHRDRRLAGAGEPREPERRAALAEQRLAVAPADVALVPGDVRALRLAHGGSSEVPRLAARAGRGEAPRSARRRPARSAITSAAVSTSASLVVRPSPMRNPSRTRSADRPRATSTGLGSGRADAHADPVESARSGQLATSASAAHPLEREVEVAREPRVLRAVHAHAGERRGESREETLAERREPRAPRSRARPPRCGARPPSRRRAAPAASPSGARTRGPRRGGWAAGGAGAGRAARRARRRPSVRRACARRRRAGRRRRARRRRGACRPPGRRRCGRARRARGSGRRARRSAGPCRPLRSPRSPRRARCARRGRRRGRRGRPCPRRRREARASRSPRARARAPCRRRPGARSPRRAISPDPRARSTPWSARLSLSVAPLVNTISRGSRAPIAAATSSRACSTAASARQP